MDLTTSLLRLGARCPHVLIVPAPRATACRLAVEEILAHRGWPAAAGPADTDVLVVAGSPGPALGAAIDRTWALVPTPRARIELTDAADAGAALDAGAGQLTAGGHQPAVESRHPSRPPAHADTSDQHAEGRSHHHGHDDDGDAGMEMPGGLPMADLGEDRDGLKLDRLQVPLGPVLPDWPTGLVLQAVLQGDVIQEVEAEVLDHASDVTAASDPLWNSVEGRAARELDALARLLGVAGWADAASRSRRLRDTLLAGHPPERVGRAAAPLVRRIRRSRTLRWLVRGIPAGATDLAGLIQGRLDAVEAALRPGGATELPLRGQVVDLAGLLIGAELAAARLIVAAVDPDTETTPTREQAQHG